MKQAFWWPAVLVLLTSVPISAQDTAATPTALTQLLAEAIANNPQVSAADHAWKAATHVARQVTTLPDPSSRCSSSVSGVRSPSRAIPKETSRISALVLRRSCRIRRRCSFAEGWPSERRMFSRLPLK